MSPRSWIQCDGLAMSLPEMQRETAKRQGLISVSGWGCASIQRASDSGLYPDSSQDVEVD